MTYEEAYKKALEVRWKVEPCFSGEECWCRLIVPETPIRYDKDDIEEVCIVSSASINKTMAEHIVKIHNSSVEQKELSDDDIKRGIKKEWHYSNYEDRHWMVAGAQWYREQLKTKLK